MNIKLITPFFCFAVLILTAFGCTKDHAVKQSITLISLTEKQRIALIEDKELVALMLDKFSAKQKVLTKKIPDFDCELIIFNEGENTQWLYSSEGFLKSADEKDMTIYRIDLPTVNQLLTNQAATQN